jgi:hypothetical protein
MASQEPSSQEIADQRRADRRALEAPVRMHIDSGDLEGMSDNFSSAGIMFFTEEPIRVTVEVSEPEGPRTYHGRIVRLQRMNDSNTGLAIEFDAD